MKWTFNQLGIIPPLTWPEFILLVCVLFLLAVTGWELIRFAKYAHKVMRGD